jgi:cephalosporin-C deacetylase-like acetyl esterase
MGYKFDRFNITDLVFKTIGKTPLIASVLVPKTIPRGKRPLLVHFHGGGLIVGDRLYETWFARW